MSAHGPANSFVIDANQPAPRRALRHESRLRLFAWLPVLCLGFGLTLLWSDTNANAAPADSNYSLSSLRVFNRVVLLIKEQYVDPDRIKPREMLLASLEAVEKRVPEVMVEDPKGDTVGVVVGSERRTFFLDDLTSLWELSFKLRDVFRFMESRLSKDVDQREIEYAAVNGMLGKLDPHSLLLEPRYSREMKLSTKGEFGGLGIVISVRDGWLTVISPIDGTPAAKAGIRAQDRIVKIGEESTINMGLDEAVEKLRGAAGTDVTIWIKHKGQEEAHRVVITRAVIRVESVTHKLLDDTIGYVKIKQFQGHTAEDVLAAVEKMRKKAGGKLTGLVLDLRNNPGGLLDQSVEVSNIFLDDGVIVITQEGGARRERREIRAVSRPGKITVPLVVLVNGGSASASEIVSGAMKNRKRAIIIGAQTFGKGSVQQLYDFPDTSSLKLTIGQYLTPGDESIQSVGITPDVRIRGIIAESKTAINLFPDNAMREEDLAAHLDDSRIQKHTSAFELAFLDATLSDEEFERRAASSSFNDDFEDQFARRLIKATHGASRKAMLDAAKVVVDQVQLEQERKIQKVLAKLDVDWSLGRTALKPKLKTKLISAEPVSGGETLKVTLEVENIGTEPLWRVRGVSMATLRLFGDREFLFGHLEPGEKRSWTSEIKIPKEATTRRDLMRVTFSEGHDRKLGRIDVPTVITGLDRPRFSYSMFIDDTSHGNGDGLLQVGESVQLVLSVRNDGKGIAEHPSAFLKNLGGAAIFIEKGRQNLAALKPGQSALAKFSFKVQSKAEAASMRMQVFDSVMGDYLSEKLTFPIHGNAAKAKKDVHVVEVSAPNVRVRAAAERTSGVLARVAVGAKLAAEAMVGDWVRVRLSSGMHGYVASTDVARGKGRVAALPKGQPTGLSMVYGRDPPRIHFEGLESKVPVVTKGKSYKIRVKIKDDGPVNDVYLFNGDEKAFYKRLRSKGPTEQEVGTQVQLKPGVNVLTFIAREDDEFAQREVLVVYRSDGDPFADLIKRSAH